MATDLTIKQMMSELNTLKLEIKNRRADLKKLTDRVKDINEKISVFL